MLRRSLLALPFLAILLPVTPAAGEAGLTRIEPRPYYGAVVTVEHGVRVWRPLPATRQMIINPTGAPVYVNVTDVRETINHNGVPINESVPALPYVDDNDAIPYGAPGYFFGRQFKHPGHRARGLGHPGRIHHHRGGRGGGRR